MKAAICEAFCDPGFVVLRDIPPPQPSPHTIVITVVAAGVNFRDLLSLENKYQRAPLPPFCPGCEVSGVVKAVGEDVDCFRIGDRVAAFTAWGGLAEEVAVDARFVVLLPGQMAFTDAAASLVAYGTAYHSLVDRAAVAAGETVLIIGASGSTGLAGLEVASALGARTIAVLSDTRKLPRWSGLHPDSILRLDEIASIKRNSVDVIYDTAGGTTTLTSMKLIAWGGRLLVIGFSSGDIPSVKLNLALLTGSSLIGVWWGEFVMRDYRRYRQNWARLCEWYASGHIQPRVGYTCALENIQDVFAQMKLRALAGKTVVQFG